MRTLSLLTALLLSMGTVSAHAELIRGRVTYRGPVPPRPKLTVDVNTEVCGAHGEVRAEDLIVGADNGLANTVVFLVGVDPKPDRKARGQLDQRNCVFLPHVQSLTVGSELVIGNDDPVVHNVHARVEGTTVFNLGMPLRGVFVKRRVAVPGVTVLSCDSGHTWMNAYVVAVPHPFHATTDADGAFTISGVAPGSYTLRAWHERLGVVDASVTVGREGEGVAELEMPLGPERKVAAPSIDFDHAAIVDVATADQRTVGARHLDVAASSTAPSRAAALASVRLAQRDADVAQGRASYQRHCASCHGDAGDGLGEAAPFLRSAPRVFTRGELEFRSTSSGELAREEDIVRTITEGLPGTEMPAWGHVLPPSERRALARYVMSFSPRFLASEPAPAIIVPPEPTSDGAAIERGKALWARFHCAQCHGVDGRANGVSRRLVDDWGTPILAADLSRGVYKSGRGGADLYRTLVTGLSGTPMPAFADLIGPRETWDLVHYVQSLGDPPGFFDGLFE